MKTLRIVGISVLVLLGLLLVAIGVVYALFDGERIKAEVVQTVKTQKQRTLSIPGELGLSVWPSLAITVGKVSLSERNSEQNFVSIDGARVSVAVLPLLSRRVSVSAVELDGLNLSLIKDKSGRFNFSDLTGADTTEKPVAADRSTPKADSNSAPLQLDIAAITLSRAQFSLVDEKTGSRSTLSDLDIRTGRIQADTGSQSYSAHSVKIAAKGKSGEDALVLSVQAPHLAFAAGKAVGESVQLLAQLSGGPRKVEVKLNFSGIHGSAAAVGVDKLEGTLELEHPAMPKGRLTLPLAGHVRADLTKSTADIGLSTQLDDSKIVLQAGVAKFSPLVLGFTLDIDQLNIDKYMPPSAPADKPAASEAGAPTDPKVDLSALKGLNLSGMVKIGALQVSNIKLSKLQAKLSVLGGQLSVAPFSANLYQGSVTGHLVANAADNSVALTQTLSGVEVGPLLKDVADLDMLDGKGTVTLALETDGATVGAMKKALDGTASLSLKEGAIKGINLGKSFRELKAKLGGGGGGQDTSQQANSNDKTDFSELSASFKIAAGVAHNEDLSMKSPFVRLGGAGDIDIGNSQINYLAKASVVGTEAGQGGQDLEQLKGLTIPVRLSGPFSKLGYKIELGNLISDAAKAKVDAQVNEAKAKIDAQVNAAKQDAKQKVEDALKDKFKGLLGR